MSTSLLRLASLLSLTRGGAISATGSEPGLLEAQSKEQAQTALSAEDDALCGKEECDLSLRQLRSVVLSERKHQEVLFSQGEQLGAEGSHSERISSQSAAPIQLSAPFVNSSIQSSSLVAEGSVPFVPYGRPSDSRVYPKYPGFTLWLVEEFDQPIDLDKDPIWTWGDGALPIGQVRFVKEQIKFEDGKMKIEVKANHGHQQHCSNAQSEDVPHKPLVSGEMRTRSNMFRYGRYEVRMKAPMVHPNNPRIDGNFVSTMFVFRSASFKHWREVDVEVTAQSPGAISTNVLYADYTYSFRPDMQETDYPRSYHHINVRSEFHDYAFEWLPDVIRWYVDGKVIREKRNDRLKIPEKSAKIMMNLWISNPEFFSVPFGGRDLFRDKFPMHNEYDWVRFYKWDGDAHYPPADMNMQSLPKEDLYLSSNNPCDGIPQVGSVLKGGHRSKPCHATCH